MGWTHRLEITKPGSGGVQDRTTGQMVGGEPDTVIYDGESIVHEGGESRPRNSSGMPHLHAEATAILPRVPAFFDIEAGMIAKVFYLGTDRWAEGEVKATVTTGKRPYLSLVYR